MRMGTRASAPFWGRLSNFVGDSNTCLGFKSNVARTPFPRLTHRFSWKRSVPDCVLFQYADICCADHLHFAINVVTLL